MKTIPLSVAITFLANASFIQVDGYLADVSFAPVTGDDENEFACISWEDDEGRPFSFQLAEGQNRTVNVSNYSLFFTDTEGEKVEISLLTHWNIESTPAVQNA